MIYLGTGRKLYFSGFPRVVTQSRVTSAPVPSLYLPTWPFRSNPIAFLKSRQCETTAAWILKDLVFDAGVTAPTGIRALLPNVKDDNPEL
jgi:hypothetical protein